MSWTMIRSSVGGGRVDPPSGSSSNKSARRPRLIKAIQDLRTKLLVKIQEIKKDLPMKLFFLLVGFYSATAFSTFIGQTGDWDVLSAALAVIVVECIGALMYRASIPLINKMRSTITMFNYWKTGLALGLFLDSFNENSFGWTQVLAQTSERNNKHRETWLKNGRCVSSASCLQRSNPDLEILGGDVKVNLVQFGSASLSPVRNDDRGWLLDPVVLARDSRLGSKVGVLVCI
ncbi:unnamed protein product [Arabis nemorensis]|uniref:Ycf20-like protein n=1 Tax=Arabis nemorensis TaxID=586526 RepID=A0A565BX29_9BRAS|nr:unnamed protein product [Arabis nemorensis]